MKICVCGLGTMGAPMARLLLEAGHEVAVFNRTAGRSEEKDLVAAGARAERTPAAAAKGVEVALVCVSDSPDVEHVVLDEAEGLVKGLERGALVIDCSTIAPAVARSVHSALAARGIGFVDAPVSGGSEGAQKGTLAIMCGGAEDDFERARPVFDVIGSNAFLVGGPGAGQVAKAVNQVVLASTYVGVAEGMVLAAQAGVDPSRVVQAIRGGAAASWVLDQRSGNMLKNEYPLGFRVRLHRKDLGIALDTARESGAALPFAAAAASYEDGLIAQGFGDEDMSALARIVRAMSALGEGPLPGLEGEGEPKA